MASAIAWCWAEMHRWLGMVWIAVTIALVLERQAEAQPRLVVQFASPISLLWTGLSLALLSSLIVTVYGQAVRHRLEHRLRSVNLSDGLLFCGRQGHVRWHSDSARVMLGDDGQLLNEVSELLKRASQGKIIQTLSTPNGARYSVQVMPVGAGELAVVCRPVQTESFNTTFYENFIRRIVHDMRNPLAGIIGHASNIYQSPTVDGDDWRQSARVIESEAQRLAQLVDSILFDARLAYVPLTPSILDLVDVLEEAVFARYEQAAQDGKSLEIEALADRMQLEADRDLLVRAFENLIDNSLKYSHANARVVVRLEEEGEYYFVQVIDNGAGIPPEYLPDRIFEPLVRAQKRGSGSGLGLSIARRIITMHGGSITATSTVGQGTTMTVQFPKGRHHAEK